MSIFVPKTFGFSAERIKSLVERELGKVRQVDIVKDTCFIHLEKWYEGHAYPTFLAIDRMEKGEAHKITSFDHKTNSYTTLFLLKNHSKKHSREVKNFLNSEKKEKDVLEQIEEGGLAGEESRSVPPMRLINPDSVIFQEQEQEQDARWRPPSPPGPPPGRNNKPPAVSRKIRTEGRLATDDQYIYRLEKEIASLRAQNHAQVKDINDLRAQIYTQQARADAAEASASRQGNNSKNNADAYAADAEEPNAKIEQKLDANNEFSAKAIPKSRRRAGAAPRESVSELRVATF